jgi:biotin transporter BioY
MGKKVWLFLLVILLSVTVVVVFGINYLERIIQLQKKPFSFISQ